MGVPVLPTAVERGEEEEHEVITGVAEVKKILLEQARIDQCAKPLAKEMADGLGYSEDATFPAVRDAVSRYLTAHGQLPETLSDLMHDALSEAEETK